MYRVKSQGSVGIRPCFACGERLSSVFCARGTNRIHRTAEVKLVIRVVNEAVGNKLLGVLEVRFHGDLNSDDILSVRFYAGLDPFIG